ncbi:MAG: hypothetical protein DRI97_04655 [Bacteroidetes bacterium]|nr:MAG: hypothetical protein DRI97_04655 [Bacteroidota bacterium]
MLLTQKLPTMHFSLKWRSGILSLFLLAFTLFTAYAQERTVTGTVSSEDLGPLPGVNIVIQGSTQGAVTDLNGHYSIDVPGPDAVLVFSFIVIQPLRYQLAIRRSLIRLLSPT